MRVKNLCFLLLTLIAVSACQKETQEEEKEFYSSNKQITSFVLSKELNKGKIKEDIEGDIKDGNITLTVDKHDELQSLIATFTFDGNSVTANGELQESDVSKNDYSRPLTFVVKADDGSVLSYVVTVQTKETCDCILDAIPEIIITTDESGITEIPSKEYYLTATLQIDGKGVFEDYNGKTEIKGRGNSTWSYAKKPYRLKLDKKAEICGFAEAKNYVLLANYLDPTLMLNAVAFKIARLLDMPFTNHAIPVDVTLNGQYKGSYMLTEQIEVKKNRIDLNEDNCVVWELDSYYDEDMKFKSSSFNLPVMLKDPDMETLQFENWKADFNTFVNQFVQEPLEGNSYVDMIDIESVAKFLLVFNLTHNMELNHPKSVYMHKEGTGKYVMGPVWDFDWGFNYEGSGKHFTKYNRSFLASDSRVGAKFFSRFLQDSRVVKLYKEIWRDFRINKMDDLLKYVEEYADVLRPSALRDSELWSNTRSFDDKVKELKTWLRNRATYLEEEIGGL